MIDPARQMCLTSIRVPVALPVTRYGSISNANLRVGMAIAHTDMAQLTLAGPFLSSEARAAATYHRIDVQVCQTRIVERAYAHQ